MGLFAAEQSLLMNEEDAAATPQ